MTEAQASSTTATTAALMTVRHTALGRQRWMLIAALLLPIASLLAVAWVWQQRAFDEALLRLDRASRIAVEHALKLFDTNQMLLQRMQDLLGPRSDAELLADAPAVHERLRSMAAPLPQVQGLFINDADARMLGSSRVYPLRRDIDYSDREWYGAHRSGGAELHVSALFTSRATGEQAFDMSRRRMVDGRFAGTVHVSLRPEYLTSFYQELSTTDAGLNMALVRRDGATLARWPEPAIPEPVLVRGDPVLTQMAAGQFSGRARAGSGEAVQRLVSYRRVGDYPLYVMAFTPVAAVRAEWLRDVGWLALLVLPTGLGFAWAAHRAMRRTRDEIRTLAQLAEETERRQAAEVALLQSQKLEAIGRLTGGVAHDFNNLLAVISGNVEVIRRLPKNAPLTGQLNAIARAVDSGSQLTRQLLALTRKQALMPQRLRLQDRLPPLLDLLRPLLGSSIAVSAEVDPDTAAVRVDPAEMELAIINLAVNASDAMDGRGRLSLRARNAGPDDVRGSLSGDYVLLDVDDSGPGIPAALAGKVLEPFFTTKPLGKGTGLGLSQVSAFCQAAGGEAQVLSAPGGGARMRLLLRASPAPADAPVPMPASLPPLQAHVLLVEDNLEVARVTAELLRGMGAQVTVVTDVASALVMLERDDGGVDVVLSDIAMPGDLDGIALATVLRQRPRPLPVVLMSGYASRLDEAVRQDLHVLPKPCTPEMLSDSLRRALATGTAREG